MALLGPLSCFSCKNFDSLKMGVPFLCPKNMLFFSMEIAMKDVKPMFFMPRVHVVGIHGLANKTIYTAEKCTGFIAPVPL